MARLYRDAYGVPHLRADSVLELVRLQGKVCATDRTWQLEWLRRRATGTTAAVLGADAVSWDRFSRRMQTVGTAERAFAACSAETQELVRAYVAGVNVGLAAVDPATVPELVELGIAPEPWDEWMPLATFLAQHLLFANIGGALWARDSRAALGDDVRFLSHEDPTASGSNAWAAAGGRTASGFPLIGGDPHRNIEQPGVYQQWRLCCEDPDDGFDVVGFSFAGVPGVQHFAHAGEVAWAITNACADYQDVREEAVPPAEVVASHRETIEVRDADPVEIDVITTPWGMLFEDGFSVRTASARLGDLGFDALLPLLRARTVDDVDRALDDWVEPVNNLVVADRSGALRYRIAGRVPTRDSAGEWTGWLEEPNRAEIPADGTVVTANERRGPESDVIGSVFSAPYRADRIHALLDGRSGLDRDAFSDIHNDTLSATAEIVTRLVPGAFDDWDHRMDADSEHAARYAAFRSELVRRIAAAPAFAVLHEIADHYEPVLAPWLNATYRISLALPRLANEALAGNQPFGLDLVALARETWAWMEGRTRDDGSFLHSPSCGSQSVRVWGDFHRVDPIHPLDDAAIPALPVSGEYDCVRSCVSYPALADECSRGSVARYVWDLADRQAGGWVVPTGADGRPGQPHHHDQLPLWAAGDLAPIVTDWTALSEQ